MGEYFEPPEDFKNPWALPAWISLFLIIPAIVASFFETRFLLLLAVIALTAIICTQMAEKTERPVYAQYDERRRLAAIERKKEKARKK